MRISFSDIARPKAAAKQLSRISLDVTLASAQEALARATGYRDWHELAGSSTAPSGSDFSVPTLAPVVLSIANALSLDAGDVQFAISKARLVGTRPWSIEDQLALHMAVLRERSLGAPARGKPGTVLKVRAHGETRLAYLLRTDHIVHVLYDRGEGACAKFEAVTPRAPLPDFLPARLWLPYGIWTLDDGSEVVFARDYLPLWRITSKSVERLDPWLWIVGIRSERWFAINTERDWWRPAGRLPALAFLERHRVFEMPKLANAMPYMFGHDVETIPEAVRAMFGNAGTSSPVPKFAVLNSNLLQDWRASRTGTRD